MSRGSPIVRMLLIGAAVMTGFGRLPAQSREIIGYYPSWKWDSPDSVARPDRIPYGKLTIINYAFFYPRPDGHLVGRDSVGDAAALRGLMGGGKLIDLAHAHGVKVLLSIGGWEDSNNFPAVAADSVKRARLASSCVN
jgi:chitinase